MQSNSLLSKLTLAIFTIMVSVAMISCEKEIIDDKDDDDSDPTISDTRPLLVNGTNSATSYENESETNGFENPFDAVSLHNPETLALVNSGESSAKKTESVDPGEIYILYEISADNFEMVQGEEGNDLYFQGITGVKRINDTWQIFGGGGESVKLITKELTINYEYEIQSDSIFKADTIPIADASGEPYENLGDTLFISADTAIFNDTLWIQLSYAYTDTIDIQIDTLETEKSVLYKSLLLNTKNGGLYDLGAQVSINQVYWRFSDVFQYRESENVLYFRNITENQICKLDLTSLSLETFSLPYKIDGIWSEVDGKFFFYNYDHYPKAFCYIPGSGLITKSNIGPDPEIGTCWTGDQNTYFWIRGVQGNIITPQGLLEDPNVYSMFTLEIRNDSLIFSPVQIITELEDFSSSIGEHIQFEICNESSRWFFHGGYDIAWTFDEETSQIEVWNFGEPYEVLQNRISNGQDIHISLFNNTIYKLDISVPSLEEFIHITELDISGFSVGYEHNIFVSGRRFSDLNDATIEYDGETGEKIEEWIQENAPPESTISFLSPIF